MSRARASTQLKPFDGFLYSDGSADPVGIKINRGASAPPTVNDDSGDGYSVGSRWFDTTNDISYDCLDASSGAAVWRSAGNGSGSVTTIFGRTGDVTATNGDYTASQITNVPAGNISSVTVQLALNELDTEKVPTTRSITGTDGVTGGGTLASDRTLSLDINGLASQTTPATTYTVPIYDGANKKMTLSDLFRVVNSFTSKASIVTGDILLVLDSAAGYVAKKATVSDVGAAIGGGGGGGSVTSVFGRTGTVVAVAADYSAAQIEMNLLTHTGLVATRVDEILEDFNDHKADLDGNNRLPIAQFPSNSASIRFARCADVTGNPGTYSATGGSSLRGQITGAPNTADGIALSAADRVFVPLGVGGNLAASGIYEVSTVGSGSNGVWDRVPDMDADSDLGLGTQVAVKEGAILGTGSLWWLYSWAGTLGGSSGSAMGWAQIPSAGAVTSIAQIQTGTKGISVDDHPSNGNVANDEFEGSSLDTTGTRFTGANAWSWYQQSSSSITQANGSSVLLGDVGDAVSTLRFIRQAVPTAPWKFRAKCAYGGPNNPDNMRSSGLVIHNTANSRYCIVGPGYINASKFDAVEGIEGTGHPTSRGEIVTTRADLFRPGYVEIENDGTTLYFRYSGSGVEGSFYTLFSRAISGFMSDVTHIGLGFVAEGDPRAASLVTDWFRRIS